MDFTREELELLDMAVRNWDGVDHADSSTEDPKHFRDNATWERYEDLMFKIRGAMERLMIEEE